MHVAYPFIKEIDTTDFVLETAHQLQDLMDR